MNVTIGETWAYNSDSQNSSIENVIGMAKKLDIKQIDRIAKEVGLTRGKRQLLHRRITKTGETLEEIRKIAEEIKELYPNK